DRREAARHERRRELGAVGRRHLAAERRDVQPHERELSVGAASPSPLRIQERFPYVDLVVGAKSVEDYPRVIEQALGARFDALAERAAAFGDAPAPDAPAGWASPHAAYVTIMRGCNYSCS